MDANQALQPIRILMVDDDSADVRLTREALKSQKIHIVMHDVADGIEAMAFLRKEGEYADMVRPDLILLDLNMPRMDGREVLHELKNDPIFKRIPVIILTTSAGEEDILNAYDMNVNCYITKPVGWQQFKKVVELIEDFWLTVVKLPRWSDP
ncbi:response regulator [bacterium]|nr:response regulator [bacterium]